jgi:DNA methylase
LARTAVPNLPCTRVKPVALVADAILDCSKRGGITLDVFAGSGTTLIAAEKAGRRGYGIEIDCHYTDIIIRRFDEVYGLKAVHAESKLDFERLANERFKKNAMVEKRKAVKVTAQKIGNPPKHSQFGEGTAVNPKGRPSIYLVKAARDQVFATARCRTISELQATAMSSLWL